MTAVHEEHLRRPRIVGLAAKFLVALGFGLGVLLLGGHAAHAADGPLDRLTHHATATVEKVTNHVVEVSAPRDSARTVRVLPHHDTEVATVVLHPRRVEVTTPALPAPVTPLRVEVPALLPSLPSVDVATVVAPTVHRATHDAAPTSSLHRTTPATPTAPVAASHAAPAATTHHAHHTAPATPKRPAHPPVDDRPAGDVPAGAASPSALSVAVLGTLGHDAPSLDVQPVHTADRRVPIAPTFEPSFTPD
ncbi:MAG: hypothetical protein JO291_16275 [Acidimicrobiia bacterium]|nr:hypothetical protein [Acidimicrobiia bacterium]